MTAVWSDTNGASNIKYSQYAPSLLAFHETHVEAAEGRTPYGGPQAQGRLRLDAVV